MPGVDHRRAVPVPRPRALPRARMAGPHARGGRHRLRGHPGAGGPGLCLAAPACRALSARGSEGKAPGGLQRVEGLPGRRRAPLAASQQRRRRARWTGQRAFPCGGWTLRGADGRKRCLGPSWRCTSRRTPGRGGQGGSTRSRSRRAPASSSPFGGWTPGPGRRPGFFHAAGVGRSKVCQEATPRRSGRLPPGAPRCCGSHAAGTSREWPR